MAGRGSGQGGAAMNTVKLVMKLCSELASQKAAYTQLLHKFQAQARELQTLAHADEEQARLQEQVRQLRGELGAAKSAVTQDALLRQEVQRLKDHLTKASTEAQDRIVQLQQQISILRSSADLWFGATPPYWSINHLPDGTWKVMNEFGDFEAATWRDALWAAGLRPDDDTYSQQPARDRGHLIDAMPEGVQLHRCLDGIWQVHGCKAGFGAYQAGTWEEAIKGAQAEFGWQAVQP